MTVNFKIQDNHALTYSDRHIDLHNNFDFTHYEYNTIDRQLSLIWTKSTGSWVDTDELSKLTLVHSGVSYLTIGNDAKEYRYSQVDRTLGDISFIASSDRQNNDDLTLQDTPEVGDDIIYIFESTNFIRVGCDKIELQIVI